MRLFATLLKAVRRRSWLVSSVVIVMLAALLFGLRSIPPRYEAQVMLQLTAPPDTDVELYDRYRASSLRDEMIVARNNFVEILKSQEVAARARRKLELGEQLDYSLDVRTLRDADFLYVLVQAPRAEDAAMIANTLTHEALAYLGELRARTPGSARELLAEQRQGAETRLRMANEELAAFKVEHGIGELADELAMYQDLIRQLEASESRSRTGEDALREYRGELERLAKLEPEYTALVGEVRRASADLDLLQSKYTEAKLKQDLASQSSFLQIVEPASPPPQPISQHLALLLAGALLGSLGLGVLLALALDQLDHHRAGQAVMASADQPEVLAAQQRRASVASASIARGNTTMRPVQNSSLRSSAPLLEATFGWIAWLLSLAVLAAASYLAPTVTVLSLCALTLTALSLLTLWRWPEWGIVALLWSLSGLIPVTAIDLRLSIGGLDLRDLMLIGVVGLLLLFQIARGEPIFQHLPSDLALLGFLALALCSACYALFVGHVEAHWVFSELRAVAFYTVYFATFWALRGRRGLIVVLGGLFALVDLAALVVIAQQFFGSSAPIVQAMLDTNWYIRQQDPDSSAFGALRVIPPCQALMVLALLLGYATMLASDLSGRLRLFGTMQFGLLSFSLLLTYTRVQWLVSLLALGLVTFALGRSERRRLLRYGLLAGLIMGLSLVLAAASGLLRNVDVFADALIARAETLLTPEETFASDSLRWRRFENEEALAMLAQHPLIGVGLGNSYRDITTQQGEARGWWGSLASGSYGRFTRYVHNSYLYVAVKMGLLGLLALGCFIAAVLSAGLRRYKMMPQSYWRLLLVALLASLVAILPWSLTQAHLLQVESSAAIGLMGGLSLAVPRIAAAQARPGRLAR